MKKLFLMLAILFWVIDAAEAQTKTSPKVDSAKTKIIPKKEINTTTKVDTLKTPKTQTEKFVNIDSAYLKLAEKKPTDANTMARLADLKLTSCDFEKDANAMVLFDIAVMGFGNQGIMMERHKRIKIFNDNGKGEANIRIEYDNKFGAEQILAVVAETMNLNNGKIEFTKLDPKLIYNEHTDKNKDVILFSMPNVRAGSVIEYGYMWRRTASRNFPGWDFQSSIPTRYSQVNILMNSEFMFKALYKTDQPFVKDSAIYRGHVWALANIPASKTEPFMRSAVDGLQGLTLVLSSVNVEGKMKDIAESWATVGKQFADDKEINKPFDQNISDDGLVKKAKALTTTDEKVAFLFNEIKTQMKWNEEKNWISKDGIKNAWKKKSGNWGEINMILCRLLKESGIKAYPMLVSTRDNGKMLPGFVNLFQINKLVTYVPVDSTKYYVLDATDKYNTYNEVPFDLLNSYGLYINKEKEKYELVFMKKDQPVKQVVFINAEIKPDGTMSGTAQVSSSSYSKSASLELHKKLDEKKYIDLLSDNDNNLKILSLKFENSDIDSLPLTQNIDFKLDLPGTDDKYIYFNPNLFTGLHRNPFISETRHSDIDFGSVNIFSINGRYKIPDGYKIEALPKSMNLVMPDKSITFKRIVAEQEGYIIVYYVINYKKSIYLKADYPNLHAYFKKMNEILNEQIVLKKS